MLPVALDHFDGIMQALACSYSGEGRAVEAVFCHSFSLIRKRIVLKTIDQFFFSMAQSRRVGA